MHQNRKKEEARIFTFRIWELHWDDSSYFTHSSIHSKLAVSKGVFEKQQILFNLFKKDVSGCFLSQIFSLSWGFPNLLPLILLHSIYLPIFIFSLLFDGFCPFPFELRAFS